MPRKKKNALRRGRRNQQSKLKRKRQPPLKWVQNARFSPAKPNEAGD